MINNHKNTPNPHSSRKKLSHRNNPRLHIAFGSKKKSTKSPLAISISRNSSASSRRFFPPPPLQPPPTSTVSTIHFSISSFRTRAADKSFGRREFLPIHITLANGREVSLASARVYICSGIYIAARFSRYTG